MQFGNALLLKKRKPLNSIYEIYREQVMYNSNTLLFKKRKTLNNIYRVYRNSIQYNFMLFNIALNCSL